MASSPFVFFAWCFVALASSTVTHALSVPQGSAAATYGRSSAASLTPIRSVRQLHNAYNDIFKTRNRNAASHLWISYLLERAPTMTSAELQLALTGFCAVSGSPVTPHDYNRYRLSLELADGTGNVNVMMHYCCWPCVCDVQDFVKVDTVTVTTRDQGEAKMHFAVIGDPCEHPEKLKESFVQPFDGRYTTLERDAPELRCGADGKLVGATYSDHGHVIIGGVFSPQAHDESRGTSPAGLGQPGRVSVDATSGLTFQGEHEYAGECARREANGHDSGMGEIFRRAAAVSPIKPLPVRRLRSS
mmetsp:Transcript_3161/g.7772  ORF Transcript_3161/g.7772 Transcript_3161/m.7772 type:complete len:302 (-) Transcript_3161:191-1096(-)